MFVKKTERCPQGKRITMANRVWVELQKHIDKVKAAREDGRQLKLQLFAEKYLILEKFHANGLWYIGVHDLSPAGTIIPFTGLNFDDSEWEMLVNNIKNINTMLRGSEDGKGKKRNVDGKAVSNEIMMFKWKWLLGKKKLAESVIGFYSEDDCKRDAERFTPILGTDYTSEKSPTLVCDKFWGPPPDKFLLMRQVYVYMLAKFIQEIARANCDGCKDGSGSQERHMVVGGCLDEGIDHTKEYYEQSKNKCTPALLVSVFDAVRRQIGAEPLTARVIAEAAITYLSDTYCISLMASPTDRSYININMLLDSLVDIVSA